MPWDPTPHWARELGHHWPAFALRRGLGVCSPGLHPPTWRAWLEHLPARLRADNAVPVRHAHWQTTGRQTFRIPGPDGSALIVKCHPAEEPAPQLSPNGQHGFRPPWLAFRCNLDLWRQGLRVPEPLALVAFDPPAQDLAWCAITRQLSDCQPLLEFAFTHLCRRVVPWPRRRQWSRQILDAIIRLHQAGYAHGDLHHHNVLVRLRPADDALEVFLMDFDLCVPSNGKTPGPDQLQDLAQLAATLYQIVPDSMHPAGLSYYTRSLGLDRVERRRCRAAVASAYHRFLHQYLACFAQIESACLAEAERRLSPLEAAL